MGKMVILITGASSGIGKAAAEYPLEKGHTVYGASRTEMVPALTCQDGCSTLI